MSVPRVKSPGSDVTSKAGSDSNVALKPALTKKSLPAPIVKSKIPKQDKANSESAKNGEKSPTPKSARRGIASKSQENPATSQRYFSKHSPVQMGFVATPMGGQKRVLENQFNTKKNCYVTLRQDINDKQKSSEKAYEDLFQLREKIISSGGRDPGRLEDLVPAPSIAMGRQKKAVLGELEKDADGEVDLISTVETTIRKMNEELLGFCKETLAKQSSLIKWLVDFETEPITNELYSPLRIKQEIFGQIHTYKVDNVEFEERLDSMKETQLQRADEMVQRIRYLWHECQVYKKERENLKPEEVSNSDEMMKELKVEKEKFMKARAKIREHENALSSMEAKLKEAQDGAKHLESQLKSKEMALEQKSREFAKLQKNHDAAKVKLQKHNDTVEARVAKLKEELEFKEAEAKKIVAEYKKQVEQLERDLENERKAARGFDEIIEKVKSRNAKLEEKCKQLLDMQDKANDSSISDQHTEYDIQLFNDLKKARKLLVEKEEIIQKLQIERDEIITAASQENDSSRERLAADLLKKTNELQATRSQFVQLQKNYQRTQQRAEHLEVRLADMSRLQAQLKDSGSKSYGTQVLQLQQQLTDLRGSLSETNKQNAELERTCAQLQLKVDRYKRYLRNLEGNMKVRSEARSLLQHSDDKVYEETVEQLNYNSINAEEYQQVCALLESKEMQLMKLEKLVKQMEKQEEYSQTQRTRLESRIAELEFAVKEGKLSQRNRGFSFL